MESNQVKQIVESLLFMSDRALSIKNIKSILGDVSEGHDIEQLIKEIAEDYKQRNSPIELRFVAEGWQFSSKKEFSPFIKRLYKERTMLRLSTSALETLSIIAYKQPITRSEIEEIRGVEITSVLETILERKLVHIVGRKETIGRPLLYGTTTEFLRHFGLGHLSELPAIEEVTPPEETLPEAVPEELENQGQQ
ncbi:MAG TPA: SMC-Scp complex subunit ScpB [Elusimicrobia bacterium]|nr:MAG: SMC-Scp complex subunit ScpB [Elusimicrobia bacterium RIFOXYA12_FULL_49_49]OGS06224.1 MAG: SMC-Scp complex subunit ScpB [Elusimicrobia bacterium RIFOXYA1_FULL_47_7]OGS11291.1 MAG: SMC-Scp complex subunit ScpB [Elusimicrobia bacterium RIFOXYB1_FULL_48_9]OGS16886.1 MAG: SMC-Scp complex subunit ScpB [Elusimicrobia bacterium RIFOXYA2_FULL_47_53]OGS32114.1 MAG: SMC-Scp complex subunit ScpB [Elusimicrobia bacterium RIFOXYB2_FULL_46_23]HBU70009.1 SMC-Scp complex subunit ScpB [Elusimicrobiota 